MWGNSEAEAYECNTGDRSQAPRRKMPKQSELTLRCQKCKYEWTETFQMDVTVKSFLVRLKGLNMCPRCSHKRIDILTGDKKEVAVTFQAELVELVKALHVGLREK